ncbi:hypothetical protein [Couchioplanes azureus]|uniref:hypothetical protein n=1 Tax=Couchioplanes caeruleus TaxID=56438 RepID=UPI0016707B5B|nr:hypothetical protein [Couchioplanes caeruleus]GGQ79091.1 hypothetical protein GCM10010166_56280 [Couchioplanes caeruleus subsp. azureus]
MATSRRLQGMPRAARVILVVVLVLSGLLGAMSSILYAWIEIMFACFKRSPPADAGMLLLCGAGFCASMAIPWLAWWGLLPRARRARLVTMTTITVLLGGIGAVVAIYLTSQHPTFRCY